MLFVLYLSIYVYDIEYPINVFTFYFTCINPKRKEAQTVQLVRRSVSVICTLILDKICRLVCELFRIKNENAKAAKHTPQSSTVYHRQAKGVTLLIEHVNYTPKTNFFGKIITNKKSRSGNDMVDLLALPICISTKFNSL